VAGLTQLFAVAVDYYHGFMGGFGDILLFYGCHQKESIIFGEKIKKQENLKKILKNTDKNSKIKKQ